MGGLLVPVVGVLVILVALFTPRSPFQIRTRIGRVRRGAFTALTTERLAYDDELLRALGISSAAPTMQTGSGGSSSTETEVSTGTVGQRSQVGDVLTAGGLTAAAQAWDWFHSDPQLLEAMSQMTHEQITSTFAMWDSVHEHGYDLLSPSSLINWRGHVGEQHVFDDLHSWLGDRVQLWPDSNHPGSDLSVDGHEFNVKVTSDFHNVASEHFEANPDIPLIVNVDAAHVPADALHVDLSQPFDPAMLDGHAVVVADGLSLSGIQDSLGDSFGDVVGGHLDVGDVLGDAADMGIPVVGSAIRIVRSGIREGKLLGVHNDPVRMAKNIAIDVGAIGGGVAAGGTIGQVIGSSIDVLSGGLTFGAGSFLGPIVGSMIGAKMGSDAAKYWRLEPFQNAQDHARRALEMYNLRLDSVESETARRWEEIVADTRAAAERAEERLQSRATETITRLRAELQLEDTVGDAALGKRLSKAHDRVLNAQRSERSILARKRAAAWESEAASADDADSIMDLVIASPGGRSEAEAFVQDLAQRRERALAMATATLNEIGSQATRVRVDVVRSLEGERNALQAKIPEDLQPDLAELKQANEKVRTELAAAGLIKPPE